MKLINITKEFLANSTPGIGKVTLEIGINTKRHKNEIETAYWLFKKFGGNITVLKEKNLYLVNDPDYNWNNKLWELKSPNKKNSIKTTFKKGLKQIINNQGGIIFDITNSKFDYKTIINIINFELKSYNIENCLIIIKKNDYILSVNKIKRN